MTTMDAKRETVTEVLVVGAGPTGLMLANCLAKLGVDVVIADGKSGPTTESRALGVQARTMEIYDQLGMIDEVLAESYTADAVVPGYGRRAFGAVSLTNLGRTLSPFPRLYVLEQSKNERLLVHALGSRGVDVSWNRPLTSLDLTPDAAHPVRATIGPGDVVNARYCVGADGASSLVRKLRGIDFTGKTNEHSFFVCDATRVHGLVPDRINMRMAAHDFVLTFPMGPNGHERLLGIVRTEETDLTILEEIARQRLRSAFSIDYGSSTWFATYRLHHRVAARFRDGPIFLAGDAAHVHSPVGAQGMNTGLQDAHNLATKLADVIQHRAHDAYLDQYEAERRPVAQRLVSTTDRLFETITSDRGFARVLRRTMIPIIAPLVTRALPRLPGASRIFGYVSQTRIHYRSLDQDDHAGDRIVGRRLPWTGDNYGCLGAMNWQVHSYGEPSAPWAEAVARELGLTPQNFFTVGRTRLQPGHLYLVRPDGFVAGDAAADSALRVFTRALRL
jgi:2-polyprenyl-6-methoxyphenol hydroxylase-like FAD-dependent oxidoreductase